MTGDAMAELLLSAEFSVGGYVRRLEVFGDRCSDMKPPLARCGGYLRARAKHRIDAGGPGWEPLSAATKQRKMTVEKLGLLSALFPRSRPGRAPLLRAVDKLHVAQKRATNAKTAKGRAAAMKRAAHEGETLALYQRAFGAPSGMRDVQALIAYAQKELHRQRLHGVALQAAKSLPKGSVERRRVGAVGKARNQRSERSTRLLGGLYDSIHLRVENKVVIVFSGPSWSGIHNRGGMAGHHARIPERRFLMIEATDLQVLSAIFADFLLDALVS